MDISFNRLQLIVICVNLQMYPILPETAAKKW